MAKEKQSLVNMIVEHEGLEPFQTPFRITDDDVKYSEGKRPMRQWTSMFDDTVGIKLNPKAKKSKDRENFLYLLNQEDLLPAVKEQLRRYDERKPGITIEDAVKIFDQTGSEGKLKFLKDKGINIKEKLIDYLGEDQGVANQMIYNLNR